MATVTDQTAEGHVEEVKLTDNIKVDDKEICPESKDLKEKDEEKIEVEDSAGGVAPATESEAANVSEENKEKEEPAAEEVKKEEPEDDKASDILAADAIEREETSKQEADSSTADSKREDDSPAVVEPAVESDEKELKDQADVTDIPEPPKQSIEASVEDSETTLVQESESETAKEPAVPEAAAEEVNSTPEVAVEQVNTTPEAAAEEVNTTPEAAAEEANPAPAAAAEENPAAAAEELNSTPEAAAEEVNTTEELPQVSSVSVTEDREAEPPVVSLVREPSLDDITTAGVSETAETSHGETISAKLKENIESPKEDPAVTDSNKVEEVSENVPEAVVSESADAVAAEAVPVKELKEAEAADVTEEAPNVPESAVSSADQESVSVDTNPVIESVEGLVKPEDKVEEEMQEKVVVAEEPLVGSTTATGTATQVTEVSSEGCDAIEKVEEKKESNAEGSVESSKDLGAAAEVPQLSSEGEKASEGVEDKKDGSLEGEKITLVETSRDIDVKEGENNVNIEEGEKAKKDDEQTPVESAKDAGEAPKAEIPAKSSQRQSNNIFLKVKQSIVKVKKAIIGKSPSSKGMPAVGKDEIKVK